MKVKLKKRFYINLLFLIYLTVLFKITVFRPGVNFSELFMHGNINAEIFTDLIKIFHNSLNYFCYVFFGNIVWFIPFGLYLVYINSNIDYKKVMLYSVSLSFTIEFLQYALGTGISEIDDLILNTFGGLIGFIIYKTVLKIKNKKQK